MGWSLLSDADERLRAEISLPQAAATASPFRSLRELAGGDWSAPGSPLEAFRDAPVHDAHGPGCRGSFQDFDSLFKQLEKCPVVELANPMPADRHLPQHRVGSNPAAHNRALLGEELS